MAKYYGGPFGAAIISPTGEIISVASNTVLKTHDPTAHGEINAIRAATAKLGTHDLSRHILYTTGYPCPMCLGAIMWANIDTVIYGCNTKDAEEIGFRDDFMYDFIKGEMKDRRVLDLKNEHRDLCKNLFTEYKDNYRKIY